MPPKRRKFKLTYRIRSFARPRRGSFESSGDVTKPEEEIVNQSSAEGEETNTPDMPWRTAGLPEKADDSPPDNDKVYNDDRKYNGLAAAERDAAKNGAPKRSDKNVADQEQAPFKLDLKRDLTKGDSLRDAARRGARKPGYRRRLIIGGFLGGGILGAFFGISLLLPFKLPALSNFIDNKAGERLEHLAVKRAEILVLRYLLNGSNAVVGTPNAVLTGNPLGDMFATLRTSRFEDRLKANYGIEVERGSTKGSIKLTHNGKLVGDNITKLSRLQGLLNSGELTGREARRAIRLIVRTEIPVYRVFKRIKFAHWFRLRWGVPRWNIITRKPGETDEKLLARATQNQIERITGPQMDEGKKFMLCLADEDCDKKPGDTEKNEIAEHLKSGEVGELSNVLTEGIEDVAKEAGEEVAKVGIKNALKDAIGEGVSKVSSKIFTKLGLAIAGIGTFGATTGIAIVQVASIVDHSISIKSEAFFQSLANLRAKAYAGFAAYFNGAAHSQMAGELDNTIANSLNEQLDGAEQSMAFNIMDTGRAIGVGVAASKKVNANQDAQKAAADFSSYYNSIPGIALRSGLISWYYTIGWVLRQVDDLFAKGIGFIIDHVPCNIMPTDYMCPDKAIELLGNAMGAVWGFVAEALGLSVDALDQGAKAFTNWAFGQTVAYEAFASETLDAPVVSGAALREMNQTIAAYNADVNTGTSFSDRVFALDNPNSLASNLIIRMPTNSTNSGMGSLAFGGLRFLGSVAQSVLSNRAFAEDGTATINEMAGVDAHGVPEDQLDSDLAPEMETGQACNAVNPDDGVWDPCNADKMVASTIICSQSISACPELAPPADSAFDFGATAALPEGDSAVLAQKILDNPNISFESYDDTEQGRGAKRDLVVTARGEKVTACGNSVYLNARLLQAILGAAGNYVDEKGVNVPSRYTFRINAFMSDHDCDPYLHPLGRAVDLGMVNDVKATPSSMGGPTYKGFATFIGSFLPPGGRIGQQQCLGKLDLPNGVIQHDDTCNHLHVAVGN